ncbi:hypothetical protein OSB04_012245 [Centaurea solstitialis]|uniref:Uncharacterized protein n=1 Tax=Centaurea solstitialis TaxID=347529 RepID=A0AA38WQK1_9ASTR|nr:hypothetical protein OSB04_012245 [Centaurea solstitialis]
MNPNDRNLGSSSRRAKCKRRAEPETPSKPSFKVDVTHTGFPPQYPPDYDVEISPKGFCITITHPQTPQPGSSSQPNQPGSSSQAPQVFPYQSFPYQPFPNPQFPPIDFGTPYQPQFVPGYQPNYQPVQEEDTSDEGELSPTTQQEEDIKFYTTPHYYLRATTPTLHPQTPHPAFTVGNIKSFIPILLDREDDQYAIWFELFHSHACAYDVLDHIDASVPRPPLVDDSTWNRLDAIVKHWIYGIVSLNLLQTIVKPGATAQELCTRLKEIFDDAKHTTVACV